MSLSCHIVFLFCKSYQLSYHLNLRYLRALNPQGDEEQREFSDDEDASVVTLLSSALRE